MDPYPQIATWVGHTNSLSPVPTNGVGSSWSSGTTKPQMIIYAAHDFTALSCLFYPILQKEPSLYWLQNQYQNPQTHWVCHGIMLAKYSRNHEWGREAQSFRFLIFFQSHACNIVKWILTMVHTTTVWTNDMINMYITVHLESIYVCMHIFNVWKRKNGDFVGMTLKML